MSEPTDEQTRELRDARLSRLANAVLHCLPVRREFDEDWQRELRTAFQEYREAAALRTEAPSREPDGYTWVVPERVFMPGQTVHLPIFRKQSSPEMYPVWIGGASPPPAPSGWRSMDSAPKDGTNLMLWDCKPEWRRPGAVRFGRWDGKYWEDAEGTYRLEPTHWMPLPAAPREATPVAGEVTNG